MAKSLESVFSNLRASCSDLGIHRQAFLDSRRLSGMGLGAAVGRELPEEAGVLQHQECAVVAVTIAELCSAWTGESLP